MQAYPDASDHEIEEAMQSAWSCFHSFRRRPGTDRANLLLGIARHLNESMDHLVSVADAETSLGKDRLYSELNRTISELKLFATLAESVDGMRRGATARVAYLPGESPGSRIALANATAR